MRQSAVKRHGSVASKGLIALVLIGWAAPARAGAAAPGEQQPGGAVGVAGGFPASTSVEDSRRRYEQALEAARREAAAEMKLREEREAREERAHAERLKSQARWVLGVVSAVVIVAFLQRHWLRPAVRVTVAPGRHVQLRGAVKAHWRQRAEPGAILRTLWARDRWRRRHRIKVEVFAGGDETDRPATAGAQASRPVVRLDLLITVAASVAEGSYVAVGRNGGVRIDVRRTAPGARRESPAGDDKRRLLEPGAKQGQPVAQVDS